MTSVYSRVRPGLEAAQWHKNGDHPLDDCRMITPDPASAADFAQAGIEFTLDPFLSEGKIVRYYRHPYDDPERECGDCDATMHNHGWIDEGGNGRIVCPGDWVLSVPLRTNGLVAHFPVKPDLFTTMFAAKAAGQ